MGHDDRVHARGRTAILVPVDRGVDLVAGAVVVDAVVGSVISVSVDGGDVDVDGNVDGPVGSVGGLIDPAQAATAVIDKTARATTNRLGRRGPLVAALKVIAIIDPPLCVRISGCKRRKAP